MEPLNLTEFEQLARDRLSVDAFDYVSGGADDEVTLRENRLAFRRISLIPRVLVDVSSVDVSTTVLGQQVGLPVLLAPAAFQRFLHPDGEVAAARAAANASALIVASTFSSASMEEIAVPDGPRWFQLYCAKDRERTRELLQRAADQGYSAICVTIDVPKVGRRERDIRNRAQLTADSMPGNFAQALDLSGVPDAARGSAIEQFVNDYLVEKLTWEDVEWIRSMTSLPVLLKGILSAADARLAVAYGIEGIVVSNHGGRQLDGVPATIDVLEEIVDAVEGNAEVLLDGGVRRGTDVVKALALGARAVLIGRPYLWGLAADGEEGVRRVLELLRDEVTLALALLGCPRVRDVTKEHVRR